MTPTLPTLPTPPTPLTPEAQSLPLSFSPLSLFKPIKMPLFG